MIFVFGVRTILHTKIYSPNSNTIDRIIHFGSKNQSFDLIFSMLKKELTFPITYKKINRKPYHLSRCMSSIYCITYYSRLYIYSVKITSSHTRKVSYAYIVWTIPYHENSFNRKCEFYVRKGKGNTNELFRIRW